MRVLFRSFDSKMASREKLFKAASEFASKLGQENLINITHSEDRDNIVITIWYWGEQDEVDERQTRRKLAASDKIVDTNSPPRPPRPIEVTPVRPALDMTQVAPVIDIVQGPSAEDALKDDGATPPSPAKDDGKTASSPPADTTKKPKPSFSDLFLEDAW
ncbi:MAG: hypothetical protein ACK4RK_02970 [Gemmataceae bacterium]